MSARNWVGLLLCGMLWLGGCRDTADKPQLWDRWTSHDEGNRVPVDYSTLDELLHRYIHNRTDGTTRFDYAGVTAADRNRLQGVVNQLQHEPIGLLSLREQHAYWINLYNAATLEWLLSQPPQEKIDAMIPGLGKDPRHAQNLEIDGVALSINDIRDRILRALWPNPLTLYALCDGTVGSPPLAADAYLAADLDERLQAQAIRYVNASTTSRWVGGKLRVATFFEQYASDFGDEPGILAELHRRALPPLTAKLQGINRIDGFFDDRRLNNWTSGSQPDP